MDDCGYLSDKREANTRVAVIKRRHTISGMRAELAEIRDYLNNTDQVPLNKTEYERLRKRKRVIKRRLDGRDPRFSIIGNRPGPPRQDEKTQLGVKSVSLDIL